MAYELIIKPEAEVELREALDWYEEKGAGLELALYQEVVEVLDDISTNPEFYQRRYKNIRIRFTKKFSYGIHYTMEGNYIFVHAILHTSRKPREE